MFTSKRRKLAAVLCAVMLTAALSSCSKGSSTAEESSAAETEQTTTTAETTESATETTADTTTESTADTTDEETDETTGETTAATTDTPIATNPNPTDDDTKLLWSERGLEVVPIDSEDGYGKPLSVGSKYLDWTLESYDGTVSGSKVTELHADFTYNGTLQTNGILQVLPSSHADYPNGLYLRVDNQAEFPYFPADQRERGKFIIENADEVYKMLELEDPPVSKAYEVAVSVSVTRLHVHYSANGYDTITVTAASKR